MREVIRQSDKTGHGGVVIQGFPNTYLNERLIAGAGHLVVCPKCKGIFPIMEGNAAYDVDGTTVALYGMKTACGASLIASDSSGEVG